MRWRVQAATASRRPELRSADPTPTSAVRSVPGLRAGWLSRIAGASRFDAALVVIVIAIAETEIWVPSGACIGGPFPFGLCNFGESLAPVPVAVVYTTLTAIALLGRRRWPVRVLIFIVGMSTLVADLRVPSETASGSLATFYVVLIGALPMGRALQTQDLRADLAAAEVREARLAQVEAAHQAVEEERARIARELHDVAAHGTSLIVVQSVAAQGVFDADPERARSALEAIETEARETLTEMRRLLADIRPTSDGEVLSHAPHETLELLVARVRAAGQPVEAHLDCGEGLGDSLELTVYRCVQEALTNAMKHAPGARTTVVVRCTPNRVDVEVENGRSERPPIPSQGGRGLAGMRERVTLLGGTLDAGPSLGGGFQLRLSLPAGESR